MQAEKTIDDVQHIGNFFGGGVWIVALFYLGYWEIVLAGMALGSAMNLIYLRLINQYIRKLNRQDPC